MAILRKIGDVFVRCALIQTKKTFDEMEEVK